MSLSGWVSALFLLCLGTLGCGPDNSIDVPSRPDAADVPDAGPEASVEDDAAVGPETRLRLERAVPSHGPFVGGTTVVLRGTGFTDAAEVKVGGRSVQPADIELIDSRRLGIVVPAGDPGPADIEVTVGDEVVSLAEGYHYDSFFVDPGRGSIAGGTFVTIVASGMGFAEGDRVLFGRQPCLDVTVVSEGVITCRAPAAVVGSVPVSIQQGDAATTVDDGYSYYDTADPFEGGLGGGNLRGTITVTVFAPNGTPIPDAYVVLGDDLDSAYQGATDVRGQITFSGPDLEGKQTVHVAKFCFERTSVVAFDASEVTVFLVPWMDPMCGMGGGGGGGRGRNGAFIEGELIWLGPQEFGPNPWTNIPPPRANEVRVSYVYTTQRSTTTPNPNPAIGDAIQRVLEERPSGGGRRGYPYRIFARPAGLAVYALAGLENTVTGQFIPYVMGVARNVLAGPGEEVRGVDMLMNIPLDHAVDVELGNIPERGPNGPDRFMVEAYMDLGGEGVIVRRVNGDLFDTVRRRTADRPFRFFGQPAPYEALSDGRFHMVAGYYTGDFDDEPKSIVVRDGVRPTAAPYRMDTFLGIPRATSPAAGERLPADRVLRWEATGPTPDFYMVVMTGGDGNPAWRHFVAGDVFEAPIPDLSTVPGLDDISAGFLSWFVYAVRIPGFRFDEFSYRHLDERYWSEYSVDFFTAQR